MGAGLAVRTAAALADFESGMDPHSLVRGRVSLYQARYEEAEQRDGFWSSVLEGLASRPGVESVGLQGWSSSTGAQPVRVEASGLQGVDEESLPLGEVRLVSSRTLETLGIELVFGDGFPERVRRSEETPVILSRHLASKAFPTAAEAPGRLVSLRRDGKELIEARVVGVAADTFDPDRVEGASFAESSLYLPLERDPPHSAHLFVRSEEPLTAVAEAIRGGIARVEPLAAAYEIDLMTRIEARSRWVERHLRSLFSLFAFVALLLTGFGLNAVLSFQIGSRLREFGIRVALGADSRDIRAHVLSELLRILVPGLLLGGVLAFGLARALRSFLFGTSVLDPWVFAAVLLALLLATAMAGAVPARRASRTDPARILQSD
ncbi:MAG: FtsX-like permease family protein [Acidobacteriota bacterium]